MMSEYNYWTEVKRGNEGVSITLYRGTEGCPTVVDESWWTWAEFLQMDIGPEMDFVENGPVTVLEE